MKNKISIYSPDKHISYGLSTLDEVGVGGGITARIRMAHALEECGHDVSLYVNCPESGVIEGVQYRHCDLLKQVDADVFIATTSGGGLDLSNLSEIEINASLLILMVHGVDPPNGVALSQFDFINALSNFVRQIIIDQWGVVGSKVFVSHRGVKSNYYEIADKQTPEKDPYGIVYTAHPSKGLESAVAVLRLLRQRDSRFNLHIYGGHQLWGEETHNIVEEPGIFYHGLIGQRKLAHEMQKYGFSLNLQSRPEPFGMVLIEAMKAGCIVITSPVGAFPEIIQHGWNGFLVKGDHNERVTQIAAAELILELVSQPAICASIRENAKKYPLDWKTIAMAWSGHWDWALGNEQFGSDQAHERTCLYCDTRLLSLADGFHCIGCGIYRRDLTS